MSLATYHNRRNKYLETGNITDLDRMVAAVTTTVALRLSQIEDNARRARAAELKRREADRLTQLNQDRLARHDRRMEMLRDIAYIAATTLVFLLIAATIVFMVWFCFYASTPQP